jgi:hypothetical protein
MNAAPTEAIPIFWPEVSAATSIGAGTYRNYETAASPGPGSSTPVSGGPTGTGRGGRR